MNNIKIIAVSCDAHFVILVDLIRELDKKVGGTQNILWSPRTEACCAVNFA
jgi:hypothetical protein